MLQEGLYEQLINRGLESQIDELILDGKLIHKAKIDSAEAPKIIAKYVADIVEQRLENISGGEKNVEAQIEFANRVISMLVKGTEDSEGDRLSVSKKAEQLLSLINKKNTIWTVDEKAAVIRPETSISQSSLFTGAIHEPQMYTELKKEIVSSNRIDMLVSFIKWSGLRLIVDELKTFTENGGTLRIITTSYLGATDIKAIEELNKLSNTEIKVSYDTKRTRLHAKAYVFYRDTDYTTAYVGSSNLSNAAISSGLEWNVKVTKQDLPETIDKISATFESYWNSDEFEVYTEECLGRLAKALKTERHYNNNSNQYTLDIQPYPYQKEILDKLEAERKVRGYTRNLVVAATGTGKTVIAALDYKRFRDNNSGTPRRLLFVAHREEILKQSLYTFRAVLKDTNFGELFVGNSKPESINALFISIQTFNSQSFKSKTSKDYYDYIVVDEFHHAAAPSYQELLSYYKPKILLGLTATPERMDGKSILQYFDQRIAAEIRLPEAIERRLLCPFQYFGVTDTIDLNTLKWSKGGYDKGELTKVYTFSGAVANKRADMVIESLLRYVTDIDTVKGLGFCVSIEHAKFMSRFFNDHNIPSMYLTGKSKEEERKNAKERLASGEVRFIFVVDIYNEGVDIPEINTVLFLRPTESLTIFLQQLGRGLRLAEGKECLTVLDFIGQANKKYKFEEKYAALLSNSRRGVTREIKTGFVSVPKGCYVQLEKVAAKYILENIRDSYGTAAGLVKRAASFEEDSGLPLTLKNFLNYHHLEPRSIYKYKDSNFSRICANAGEIDSFEESIEKTVTKSLSKFAVINSQRWIKFLLEFLPRIKETNYLMMNELERRMMNMFYYTVWGNAIEKWNENEMLENLYELADCPVMLNELLELLQYQYERIDFIDQPVDVGFDCPLDLHCNYTRDQILIAMDHMNPSNVREGVKWLEDKKLDIFFITLNKSDKDYSPTTMYRDYSINEKLFHWQSQSTTTEKSKTGQRYIHNRERNSKVLLFVREFKKDEISGGAAAYTYFGTANYVRHDGEKPMNIIWQLDEPIPAKYLKKTNKLLVG